MLKRGRKIMLLTAVAALSIALLGACADKKADGQTAGDGNSGQAESAVSGAEGAQGAGESSVEEDTGAETAGLTQELREELQVLLREVQDGVQPGTAGCSLKAGNVAVQLLSWGDRNSMSVEDAKAITEEFVREMSNEFYGESIALVDESCKDLQGEEAAGILESIGMTLDDKTWGDEPLPLVEAVMEASGLR